MSTIRLAPPAVLVLPALLIAATVAQGATRYDPRLRFRTISTARFDIHFHQGEEAIARRLAAFVEEAAAGVDRAVGAASGRVQIILVDQHDLSNGWATPLPYNTIEISAAAPTAESNIGNTDDWLHLVFVHEYTHIAHLSRAGGWIGGLRRGFGRLPVLFPNLYQPVWAIEGLATWRESAATGQGRVTAGDFSQLIDRAARAGRFEPIDRANGGNVDWPSGATPYVYGGYFHEYLADRYGPDTLRTLADETARRLPYLGSRAYRKVFGRSLGQLWTEFAASSIERAERIPTVAAKAVRLTHHGFIVAGPRYAPDGRLFYSAVSPHHFPALMTLDPDGEPRQVRPRYLGNTIGVAGERLVVDEIDLIRGVALQSDLYEINPRDGSRRRLTQEARAGDPDVSASGMVVCTIQASDRRSLATFSMPRHGELAEPHLLIGEAGVDFAGPRWSPDSRLIAAERRQLGRGSQIVVIDPANRQVRVLAELPGRRSGAPTFTPDGRQVMFSSAVGAEPFRIYAADVGTGALSRLEGTGASAQSPAVSADGRTLVYVGYTADGYDLFSLPLVRARWEPVVASVTPAAGAAIASAPIVSEAVPSFAYSPWRTLAPQFWTPTVENDGDELVVGAATGSVDALGRHAYAIDAGWSGRPRPDWEAAYAYDRWRPTFFVSISDDTDSWRVGHVRTRELESGMLLRFARVRLAHATLASVYVARETFDCEACAPAIAARVTRASLRAGWEISSARSFGYSISAEEGARFSTTAEATREELGADGNGLAVTADARGYWRAGPRHAVFAIRTAAAGSWGDDQARRVFSAAGSGPQSPGFAFGTDAVGLLRGFDDQAVVGRHAVVVNADYRLPIARIDRGAGTIPVFLRAMHAAVFVDAGNAWTNAARWSDVRVAVGTEISLDAVIGFSLPLTFTAGGAWRRDGAGGERRLVAFTRVGRAF